MTDRDDPGALTPEDADAALAAEYALRLLDPAETAECARREAADPAFAAAVARWRADSEGVDGAFVDAPPPPALRDSLEAALFGRKPGFLARFWSNAGLWRGIAAAATIAALWLAFPVPPPPDAPRLVSSLAPAAGATQLLAVYDPAEAALRLTRVAGEADPGRSLELWVIAGDAAPVSLGVLPETAQARVALPVGLDALINAGAVLAVTDEPPGGSPTGAPTGEVRAAGPLLEI